MARNVTIRLDEALLKKCRHAAVEEDKSLSRWISDLIARAVSPEGREGYQQARKRALKRLEEGFALGGRPLSREDVHER